MCKNTITDNKQFYGHDSYTQLPAVLNHPEKNKQHLREELLQGQVYLPSASVCLLCFLIRYI